MNRKKADSSMNFVLVTALVFLAVSGVLLYAWHSGDSMLAALPETSVTARPSSSPTASPTVPTLPPEVISLDVNAEAVDSDVTVTASASVNEPYQIMFLDCVLTDSSGETVYSSSLPASEGRWQITGQVGSCVLTVSARTDSGAEEIRRQELNFTPPEFIWPVEPQYQMLLHDRYQVSAGSSSVGGYTHNNGLMREKHYVFGDRRNHYGFDITAAPGSEVKAAADGSVLGIYRDTDDIGSTGYGNYIIVRHADKHNGMTVYTLYAHLSLSLVSSGDQVLQGQAIALSGNTGGSRIPHLHLEFRVGGDGKENTVDPLEMLPARDFSLMRADLEGERGFRDSSIALYADMLSGGWEYTIRGRMLESVERSGITVPAGAEVEIIGRGSSTVTCRYNGTQFSCAARLLEYTYNNQ